MANFADLQANPNKKPTRLRVNAITFNKNNVEFPLKPDHIRKTRTLHVTDEEKKRIENNISDNVNIDAPSSSTHVDEIIDKPVDDIINQEYLRRQSEDKAGSNSEPFIGIDKDRILKDKSTPLDPMLRSSIGTATSSNDPHAKKADTSIPKPDEEAKDKIHPNVPERFIPKLDDPETSTVY